jgi:signal peptidase
MPSRPPITHNAGLHRRPRSAPTRVAAFRFAALALEGLLLAVIGVAILAFALARLVPVTGHETLVIAGGSMEPSIPLGAAVVLERVDTGEIRPGEVVTVRAPGNALYTHRVVRTVEREGGLWLETKGDANAEPDPVIVPAAWVAGRVMWSEPLGGYLLRLLALPTGVLAMLCLAITLIAAIALLETPAVPRSRAGRIAARPANTI